MENAALRYQLKVYKRKDRKPKIKPIDQMFWLLISQIWPDWKARALVQKKAHPAGDRGHDFEEKIKTQRLLGSLNLWCLCL